MELLRRTSERDSEVGQQGSLLLAYCNKAETHARNPILDHVAKGRRTCLYLGGEAYIPCRRVEASEVLDSRSSQLDRFKQPINI
jgi:hypothetical protein